jgi:hypothetical protein
MSETLHNNVQNLLAQTYIVRDKYDKIDQLTGGKFNIYSILGVQHSELSHSNVLGDLLNHTDKDPFI